MPTGCLGPDTDRPGQVQLGSQTCEAQPNGIPFKRFFLFYKSTIISTFEYSKSIENLVWNIFTYFPNYKKKLKTFKTGIRSKCLLKLNRLQFIYYISFNLKYLVQYN